MDKGVVCVFFWQVNQVINLESKRNITMDRMTLYCVPVPGETEWVKKISFYIRQDKQII